MDSPPHLWRLHWHFWSAAGDGEISPHGSFAAWSLTINNTFIQDRCLVCLTDPYLTNIFYEQMHLQNLGSTECWNSFSLSLSLPSFTSFSSPSPPSSSSSPSTSPSHQFFTLHHHIEMSVAVFELRALALFLDVLVAACTKVLSSCLCNVNYTLMEII